MLRLWMDHVDSKYIGLLSSKLEKFTKVKAGLYNFRCPICGDSKKNKLKTRGYLYAAKTNTNFKCHNCGASMSFNNFLKKLDTNLHKQYAMEKFKEGFTGKNYVVEEPKIVFTKPVFTKKVNLPKASEVETAKKYLEARNIDASRYYYAEKFKTWVNTLKPTFESTEYDEDRIIIPLFYNQNLVGLQGRSIKPNPVKYITVMLDDNAPKIYGLDNIRTDATVYITEGPFDSTFIRNAIAMCGADADLSNWGISDPVWIYDNEPRNREIVSRIARVIEMGQKIVIWPLNIKEKDINDMVMSGHDVQNLVESNTYTGLQATSSLTWKKI
jgi:transcription elongation factor Elf1